LIHYSIPFLNSCCFAHADLIDVRPKLDAIPLVGAITILTSCEKRPDFAECQTGDRGVAK